MGLRDYLTFFVTSSGAQMWAEREMGNTTQNTATLITINQYLACYAMAMYFIMEVVSYSNPTL